MLLTGASPWVSGALAAAQAALLSFLVIVLPAVAVFVTTSADPTNAGVSWTSAVAVGAHAWLLGHGVPVLVGDLQVSLIPWGITAIVLACCSASMRRAGALPRSALGAAVGTYTCLVTLVAALLGVGPAAVLRAALGAAVVGGLGLATGWARQPGGSWRALTPPLPWSPPRWAALSALSALYGLAVLVLVAALVTVVWVVAGMATIADVVAGLQLDAVGGVVLAVAQTVWVPSLVGWAVAWLAGPGFAVGAGTRFALDEVTGGPMPAIPLLGALPTSSDDGLVALIGPLVLVAVGVLAGFWLHRRLTATDWWQVPAAVAVLTGGAAVGASVLVAASSGSIGPGRMSEVGAPWWVVGPLVAALMGLGAAVVLLPGQPLVRGQVRRWGSEAAARMSSARRAAREPLSAGAADDPPGAADATTDGQASTRQGEVGDGPDTTPVPAVGSQTDLTGPPTTGPARGV